MNNDPYVTGSLPIPHLKDMQELLRIACRLHELPAPRRAEHLLDGASRLIGATAFRAWRLDGVASRESAAGGAIGGVALPVRGTRSVMPEPTPEDDPAVALLARSARKRTPVVRFRDELIEPETWRRAVRRTLPPAFHDGIYSLHHDPAARSLLAFYRVRGSPTWGERERGILHLLHAQGGWVLAT